MKKTKIFDCSNSSQRPSHRSISRGPKENDVMRSLKKYAHLFNCEYVTDPSLCDVIITNDIYPIEIENLPKPKVKRMDGVFWSEEEKERNDPLNKAAMQSDCVIFISEYSQESFECLYGGILKRKCIITNRVDDKIYFPIKKEKSGWIWVASASNWARKEKRYDDMILFARDIMLPYQELYLIGQCDFNTEDIPRVKKFGYIDDENEVNKIMNMGRAFINLSYRDSAPKVVCQADNCELPVLFANSGGTREVLTTGMPIRDPSHLSFGKSVPNLDPNSIKLSLDQFMMNFDLMNRCFFPNGGYMKFLEDYFNVICSVAH